MDAPGDKGMVGQWHRPGDALRETQARIESILRLDYETFVNASFFLRTNPTARQLLSGAGGKMVGKNQHQGAAYVFTRSGSTPPSR